MHGFTLLLVLRLQFHGPSSRLLLCICRKYPCPPWPLTCLAKSQPWINRISLPFQACSRATEYLWRKTHSHVLSHFKFRAVKFSGFLKWLGHWIIPCSLPPHSPSRTLSYLPCFASLFFFPGINLYFTEKTEVIRRECLEAHIPVTSLWTPTSIPSDSLFVPVKHLCFYQKLVAPFVQHISSPLPTQGHCYSNSLLFLLCIISPFNLNRIFLLKETKSSLTPLPPACLY